MSILGQYQNGNYSVTILSNGTKIRENDLDFFEPAFPESMDIKITNACDMGCAFCHEDSKPNGKHGDILNLPFLESLHPYTELAIGGGNPLAHPDFIPFLQQLKERNLIANVTVNQAHFEKDKTPLLDLTKQGLVYGLGISYTGGNFDSVKKLIADVKEFPNAVLHVINGVVGVQEFAWFSYNGLKILILGYKDFRRGVQHHANVGDAVERKQQELYEWLPYMVKNEWFSAVSFDNLAINQLNVRRLLSKEEWDEFYMGDDGRDGALTSASMYVDAVEGKFAKNSCSEERFDVTNDITQMFHYLREREGKNAQ